jgi:TatD DNase family protein
MPDAGDGNDAPARPVVRYAAGIWPRPEAVAERAERVAALEGEIGRAPPGLVTAIGECGLDHHQAQEDRVGERELFEAQIDLARRLELPYIVHSRDAPEETIDTLKHSGYTRGIIHCYSYSPVEAEIFLGMGFHISFAGNITYKKTDRLKDTLKMMPPDKLLLETDSPFLSPQQFRGTPNNPALIIHTYTLAAELRGIGVDDLCALVAKNAHELLGI